LFNPNIEVLPALLPLFFFHWAEAISIGRGVSLHNFQVADSETVSYFPHIMYLYLEIASDTRCHMRSAALPAEKNELYNNDHDRNFIVGQIAARRED
jgi:hypothetical protein